MVKKLGPVQTMFTLIKGFISMGFLFIPNGFYMGGMVFSCCAFVFAGAFTLISLLKLVKLRAHFNCSLSDMA